MTTKAALPSGGVSLVNVPFIRFLVRPQSGIVHPNHRWAVVSQLVAHDIDGNSYIKSEHWIGSWPTKELAEGKKLHLSA